MNEYRITAKVPREHLWYGGYFREFLTDYFKLDSSDVTDECQLNYADDYITHVYIFDSRVSKWLFDGLGAYIFSLSKVRDPIMPKCHVVDSDDFSYEVIFESPSDVDKVV